MTDTQTFSADVYAQRLHAAQKAAADKGIDLLLIGTGPDFAYLTGSWVSSHERLTVLVVPQRGTAWIAAPNTDITDIKAAPVGELDVELRGWNDGEDPYKLALHGAGDGLGKVALGQSLTADHVLRFQDLLPRASYELATYALAELFTRKDEAEIAELRKAGRAIDAVHAQVPQLLQAGRTEVEVAHELEKLILREHSVIDFVIVGSGPNGANPHHSFSDRVLAEGEPVVVDIGGTLPSGYHSDCTRTYVVGGDISKAPQDFQDAYAVLADAQAAGRAAAHPGSTAADIDAIVRQAISAAGWGDYFVHRTGHGIGLSTHEEPFIMEGNDLALEEGMAFSIEPGIYLEGKWGMRLEDIVVLTNDGYESLNLAPRDVR
ncbi:Xaa-Pro peptidase family protein [Corynebacterium marquesiae]|uniref:M24 family metallopeptidase n=1 Tax=Corynebacterium marquesiae TaxID=2913503 RepID=UPI00254D8AD3|nr:Xaa-Pro peptidase family protein [Corynebacterium marquesiae]MDK8454140.1 Xaa-Pro peptidase family protein [Corynebacterium marquesiae]MDK8724257.1 Xaa-Pro peptidase family protein [Corynebacterium marquesiae]MDK8769577.1 Xaa-Pro peptidase family protein [Corynebacterium marquesiae]